MPQQLDPLICLFFSHSDDSVCKSVFYRQWCVMMTSSNGNILRVTGHLSPGPRWIPRTKASDAERLICVWINDWVNTREAGDLGRLRAHYDVIVMLFKMTLGLDSLWLIRYMYSLDQKAIRVLITRSRAKWARSSVTLKFGPRAHGAMTKTHAKCQGVMLSHWHLRYFAMSYRRGSYTCPIPWA